jgi:PadR family transcriptional regulator AphA
MSLKHAILVMLDKEPSSGYDLMKQFNSGLGYFWNAKHQQIYQQLKKLSEDALITCEEEPQHGKPDKKVYRITEKGQQVLKQWLHEPSVPAKINDALLVKIWGGHHLTPKALLKDITEHKNRHTETLSSLRQLERAFHDLSAAEKMHYQLPFLTLRRGILGEEAWLKWAQEAENTLKK